MPIDLTPEQRTEALRLIRQWTAAIGSGSDDADRALDALLAAGWRPVPQPPQEPTPEAVERAAVVVSPLLWLPLRTGSEAMSAFSGGRAEYSIIPLKEGGYRVYGIPGDSNGGAPFSSVEDAKAAAQADFEQRILSALTAPA